jgi:hypothetical protein
MLSPRLFAPWLLAAVAAAASAQPAPSCPNQQMFLMPPVSVEAAQVGMVGHIDNGTYVDSGSYRAQLVVDVALADALAVSLAAGCSQYVHQNSVGNITTLGIGTGSYTASTEVVIERPGTPLRLRLAPVMVDSAGAATNGTVDHPHDPRLTRRLMRRVLVGDVIALESSATATGTIINGWVADQVQVLYTWSTLTPWLEVRLP